MAEPTTYASKRKRSGDSSFLPPVEWSGDDVFDFNPPPTVEKESSKRKGKVVSKKMTAGKKKTKALKDSVPKQTTSKGKSKGKRKRKRSIVPTERDLAEVQGDESAGGSGDDDDDDDDDDGVEEEEADEGEEEQKRTRGAGKDDGYPAPAGFKFQPMAGAADTDDEENAQPNSPVRKPVKSSSSSSSASASAAAAASSL